MRTLYLDCSMGAAGDMLTAALLELYGDESAFLQAMNALGLPGVTVSAEKSEKCGIVGTHVAVRVDGAEEEEPAAPEYSPEHAHDHEHDHGHEHDHEQGPIHDHGTETEHHHHHHTHRSLQEIGALIAALPVSEGVRRETQAVYRLLAEAEGKVHGRSAGEVHFHEVGTLDALADVVGVCWLLEKLAPEKILASSVHVGSGTVRCAHGELPVPAPATAELLRGIPIYSAGVRGELCTPTGAALLRHFVAEFTALPPMTVEATGWGMGRKDFPRVNGLRAFLGDCAGSGERVCELCCNLDDMTAEAIGSVQELLWRAGALDVYTVPIGMKKNRPGTQLWCMCRSGEREKFQQLLLRHTSTWGLRVFDTERVTLSPHLETVETRYGAVRVKCAEVAGEEKWKCEYEDAARLAAEQGVPLRCIMDEVTRCRAGK